MEKVINKTISASLQSAFLQEEGLLERLIAQNQEMIHNVALYLSGDKENIPQVMEEVFVRLYQELTLDTGEDLNSMIHRLAYEVSLEIFMAKIQEPKSEKDGCYDELRETEVISEAEIDNCLMYESEQEIAEISAKLEASAYMINDLTKQANKKKN
ncbi:MAG: hypothetical protein LBE20_00135 [Deltaproteobacteria bacterium]|jgi:DNA-directed RNA polymerase specialized sigma24 family protein|nr:hypothetical protein [Deltaproteobacteria bacterium]